MFKVTDARLSVFKDTTKQVSMSLRNGKIIVDLVDESAVSDYVDLDLVKSIVEEIGFDKKIELTPLVPLVISYKGSPLIEIMPSGKKILHPATASHLGIKLFFHKLSRFF